MKKNQNKIYKVLINIYLTSLMIVCLIGLMYMLFFSSSSEFNYIVEVKIIYIICLLFTSYPIIIFTYYIINYIYQLVREKK